MIINYLSKLYPKRVLALSVFFVLAIMAFVAFKPIATMQKAQGIQTLRWTVGDTVRQAMVYIPAGAKTKPTPVIFAFHGHGGSMMNMYNAHRFDKLWPEAIIVYPQGLNTVGQLVDPQGKLPGWQSGPGSDNDRDLHFFDSMLKTLHQDYNIDDKRIYATGHSNGGGFTYLLWATRGDVFAAVAPSSAVGGRFVSMLKPKPAMHIMGEKDPLVKPEWQKMMYTAVLKLDNCNKEGQKYDTLSTLYASTTGNPVVLFIHPGGHAYPLEANAVVIKFFKSQAKQ